MLIGLLHYHLRGGGVTRVIEATVHQLKKNGHDAVVACGEKPEVRFAGPIITHDSLGYGSTPDYDQICAIANDLDKHIKRLFGRIPDIWHIHNHSLGKNTTLPLLASHWATQGIPIILQIHDFAEDGRAANYHFLTQNLSDAYHSTLYPQASHIHYVTLTRRDQRILRSAGFQDDRLHVLPNPVSVGTDGDLREKARSLFPECKTLILYPVRGIRRKNLGEFLLHSVIAMPGTHFATTLSPKNPKQLPYYQKWVDFAHTRNLPVTFEAGHQQKFPFHAIVNAADLVVTTSITEGFGLAYLEPWLMNRPLYGRDLPEVTVDFKENGIILDNLYTSLPVPLKWLHEKKFFDKVENELTQLYQKFGRKYHNAYLEQYKEAVIGNGTVDFGRLDEDLQCMVLERLLADPPARDELRSFAPSVYGIGTEIVANNREWVNRLYSPEAYYRNLIGIYNQLASTKPGPVSYADEGRVLDQFLKPEQFYFIKSY